MEHRNPNPTAGTCIKCDEDYGPFEERAIRAVVKHLDKWDKAHISVSVDLEPENLDLLCLTCLVEAWAEFLRACDTPPRKETL